MCGRRYVCTVGCTKETAPPGPILKLDYSTAKRMPKLHDVCFRKLYRREGHDAAAIGTVTAYCVELSSSRNRAGGVWLSFASCGTVRLWCVCLCVLCSSMAEERTRLAEEIGFVFNMARDKAPNCFPSFRKEGFFIRVDIIRAPDRTACALCGGNVNVMHFSPKPPCCPCTFWHYRWRSLLPSGDTGRA